MTIVRLRRDCQPSESQFVSLAERRLYARQEVIWSGRLDIAGKRPIECAVLDISATGASVIAVQPLRVGQHVTFVSPRFEPVTAQVVWSEGRRASLRFLDGFDRVLRVLSGKDGEAVLPAQLARLR